MRLTILCAGINIILIIYFAAGQNLMASILSLLILFFVVENLYLRIKLRQGDKLKKLFGEMTTDELSNLKERLNDSENK